MKYRYNFVCPLFFSWYTAESVSVIQTDTFGKPVRPASSAADAHSGSQA